MKTLVFLALAAVAANAQSIKVMSYNIRLDVASDGVNQWSNRKVKLPALIAKHDPDLVGLQEVLHNQLIDIRDALPQYEYAGVGRDDGKEKGEYSCVLYRKDRFEVLWQRTSWLSETPDVAGSKSWDAAITRIVTRVCLKDKKTGKEFIFYNTHFDHIGKQARKNSASLILSIIKKEKDGLPVIVTGDFNSSIDDEPYRIIANKLTDCRPSDSTQGTYCTFAVNGPACKLIDHIFISPEWNKQQYEVIKDNDGTNYPSDHLPVTVVLGLRKLDSTSGQLR